MTQPQTPPHLTDYQQGVATYWDNTATGDEQNVRLGAIDGYYHHHYGLGRYKRGVLEADPDTRDDLILAELHRLEHAQANYLLNQFSAIGPDGRMLDAGSGRGGTSFLAHERDDCRVDGVSISRYQVDFANRQAAERGCADQVQFHLRDMLHTGFPNGNYEAIWTNETTMYVDLDELFAEFARLLEPGIGRYVCITGTRNDLWGEEPSDAVQRINDRYQCAVHRHSDYFAALARHGLVPWRVQDLTEEAMPYWVLRQESSVRTGVEADFLEAYNEGSFNYLLIVADRVA